MTSWLWLVLSAHADIAPTPLQGTQFVTHSLKIDNMSQHPGFFVLVHSPDTHISTSFNFTSGGTEQVTLANGRSSGMATADMYLMTQSNYEAWNTRTSRLISEQLEACERGLGCEHISRFEPSYPAPSPVVACHVTINTVSHAPKGTVRDLVDVYRVVTATPNECVMQHVGRFKDGTSIALNADPTQTRCGCASATPTTPAIAWITAMLIGWRRTQRRKTVVGNHA